MFTEIVGAGLLKLFHPFRYVIDFDHCRSSVAVTLVKHECDSKSGTGVFANSISFLTEKLTNVALIIPPLLHLCIYGELLTRCFLGVKQNCCYMALSMFNDDTDMRKFVYGLRNNSKSATEWPKKILGATYNHQWHKISNVIDITPWQNNGILW